MLGQNLKQLYESLGPKGCVLKLRKLLKEGKAKPEDFSLRELAESFVGPDWVKSLWGPGMARYADLDILEAGEGVDVSAFSNITGQLVFSKIHQGWDQVEKICDGLFTNVPTNLDGEVVPGVGRIKGVGEKIHPGQAYPEAGFGEQYWNTPRGDKHGEIVSVTKEAIFFDRTALVLKRAAEVGERLSYNKESRCLACLAGITVRIGNESFNGQNHVWNGDSFNTYSTTDQTGSTSGGVIKINALASNELVDWTDLESLWLLFKDQRDPDTGLPINVGGTDLVVMPAKYFTASRNIRATQIRHGDTDEATSVQTVSPPVISDIVKSLKTSALLYQLIIDSGVSASNAKQWYFLGNFKKAFEYRENWPLQTFQAPPNSTAEFERDIVLRYKASERGVPWVADPRYVAKGYSS